MRLLCVVGTRPNFVKMAALYKEMSRRDGYEAYLVHTGQHYDANMSNVFFTELGLPEPDIDLEISGGSHVSQTTLIMQRIEPILNERRPDAIIVVGDVNSTLAASLTAMQCGIPVVHVEAGLRSFDRTMPEETNRIVVDQIADFLFVTEQSGMDNLKNEGVSDDRVFLVGNVMVDTLLANLEKAKQSDVTDRLGLAGTDYLLATLHRPANSDDKTSLSGLLDALLEISRDCRIVLPVHPRTRQRMADFGLWEKIENEAGMLVTEPLGYLDFLSVMAGAKAVLTDSGGIQEETTILGVPCITMRNNTERPVTITHGTNTLAGTDGNAIVKVYRELSGKGAGKFQHPPLWDGNASGRILDILEDHFGNSHS